MTVSKLLLVLRTVRYLRSVQIVWRVWRMVCRPRPRKIAKADLRAASGIWQGAERQSSMTGPEEVRYLNRTENIAGPEIWNRETLPKLWLYNLHYFDDLVAAGAHTRTAWHRDLIARWIAENPAPTGNGWEPYPTSLRIVNWAKWALAGNTLPPGGTESLASQADWLSRNLEYHILGNHLFANAKALMFAGVLIDGPIAAQWRATGLNILERELEEQQLPCGGHFELSPMYHSIFIEDLLDLVQLSEIVGGIPLAAVSSWRDAAGRALDWLDGMTHPDGRIAFFNDAAFGIAPEPAALSAYAGRLGIATQRRKDGQNLVELDGYARLSAGAAVLLCDAAPIGPDYLPGHAHADSLTFELSVHGHRIVVNGGTSVYGEDPQTRLQERGTAAHNTVSLHGENSSEIWSSFRVARRARIVERSVAAREGTQTLTASHDGFRRFGGPLHRRTWTLSPGRLEIRDELAADWQSATARIRLAPGFTADAKGIHGPVPIGLCTERVRLRIETGAWAHEFGKRVPCQVLCLDFTGPQATTTLTWEP